MTDLNPIVLNSLQTSLAVGVLFGLVLLVRRPFARQFGAKAAYALWLAPLARLFMPPLPASFSIFGLAGPTAAPEATPSSEAPQMIFVTADRPAHAATGFPAPPSAPTSFSPINQAAEPGLIDQIAGTLPSLIVPLWIVGIGLVLIIGWRKQIVFHRLISNDSEPASDAVTSMANAIAQDLKVKRRVDVRTSLLYGSPLVTGLAQPVILLPAWFESDYTPREQRDALTHELMHVKRHDLFALQAAQFVLALQWFNPLAHLAMRAFRIDQEAACDADVLRAGTSSAFSYGQTLVKAARLAGPADGAFRGANLTLTHPIKERLILMQNTAPTLRRRLLGSTLALTLGSAAIVATASCAASAAPRQEASANELAGGTSKETSAKQTRVYRFSSHDGDDTHQFVMLSDPFEKLQPRLDKLGKLDLSDLEAEMNTLSIELSNISELEALKELENLGDLKELEGLATLGDLHLDFDLDFDFDEDMDIETIETDSGVKIIMPRQEIVISKPDGDDLEVQIEKIIASSEAHAERAEALAEMIEKRAEARAEAHEQKAEALAEMHEQRAERIALVVERKTEQKTARMDELAEQMEARIDAAFEDGLEDDLEAAGDLIGDLAEECEDRSEDLSSPIVLTATGADGETYSALCVAGGSDRLQDEDVKAFVMNNDTLSAAEKERFESNRTTTYEYSWQED